MEIGPHWKKIWLSLSGQSPYIASKEVKEILEITDDILLNGITCYQEFTPQAFLNWKSSTIKEENSNIELIIKNISYNLQIDAKSAWTIFCNYLMYEYHGKIENINEDFKVELLNENILIGIWKFYNSERIFLIKVLRHILEKSVLPGDFQNEYKNFIKKKTIQEIQNSLIKQLTLLVDKQKESHSEHFIFFKDWSKFNYREQLEIMISILSTVHFQNLDDNNLKSLFNIFQKQNVGDLKLKDKNLTESFTLFENIKCLQNAIVICTVQDWWTDIKLWLPLKDCIKELVTHACEDTDYASIYLIYSILLIILQNSGSTHGLVVEEYQLYIRFSFKNEVFKILHLILSSPVLQNPLILCELRKATCCFMESVCFYFNIDDCIYQKEESILVLCELLKEKCILDAIMLDKFPAVKSLYKYAVRMFPLHFEPLTQICKAIATHSEYIDKVISDLENIRCFTENYSTSKNEVETHILSGDYFPFGNDTLIIESGTPVITWKGQHGNSFKVKYSYFTVLQRMLDIFVTSLEHQKGLREPLLDKVSLGFELFYCISQYDLKKSIETFNINGCLFYINHLIHNCANPNFDDIKVLNLCFKLSLVLIKYKGFEAAKFLINSGYLPEHSFLSNSNTSLTNLLTTNLYKKAVITRTIFKANVTTDTVELIELYLDFVQLTLNFPEMDQLQTTGLIFTLLFIFPKLTSINFEGNLKYEAVIDKCLNLLIFVLEKNMKSKLKKKNIYGKIFEAIIESDLVLKSVIRIFAIGNSAVQDEMEKETDWDNGPTLIYLSCIKKSLIATKLFLSVLDTINDETQLKAITKMMSQIQYYKKNIIKILSSFLNYSFDISVPKIVCRIINSLAKSRKLLIYAMLEADYTQVNSMFLDRLRDPLYDEDTKVAVVELVATCVETQFGMTAAFFNVYDVHDQKTQKLHYYGENISNFMLEYLHNIKNSLASLNNPLQNAILHLFYQLWINKKSYLISVLIQKDTFWTLLIDPLFHEFNYVSETYAKILTIVTVELHSWLIFEKKCSESARNTDSTQSELTEIILDLKAKENLKQEIKKFLDHKNDYINRWLEFLSSKTEKINMFEDEIDPFWLLKSWKNFIIITIKSIPDALNEQSKTRELLKLNCLNGLINYFNDPKDSRILNCYSELLLLLVSNFTFSSESDFESDFENFLLILGNFTNCYTEIGRSVKQNFLAIICHIIEQQSNFIVKTSTYIARLLELFCKIFIFEYEFLMVELGTKSGKDSLNAETSSNEDHTSWILLLSIINKLLKVKNIDSHLNCFKNYQVLLCLLTSVEFLMGDVKLLKTAKITVLCLVNYAQSSIAEHFLILDLNHFYESVRPPKEYINIDVKLSVDDVPWFLREFWTIYSFLLNLFYLLQIKFGFLMYDHSLSFLHLYNDVLKYLTGLVKLTSDPTALQLTCSCLRFIKAVFKFKGKWWTQNEQSFNSILNSIKDTLNISVGVILRPNILVFKTEENQYLKFNKIEAFPENKIVKLINMHIQIISWCLRCLKQCSPDLIDILNPIKTCEIFFDLVEHDYGVPKLILENPESLNYGTLLCVMHFLCKTLTQMAQQSNNYAILRKRRIPKFKGFKVLENNSNFSTDNYGFESKGYTIKKDLKDSYSSSRAIHTAQRFTTSGVYGMSVPWLNSLNSKLVAYTLELVTTFMAEQIFISLHDPLVFNYQQKQFIKRELCSELHFFHDFIRKRVEYLYDYNIQGNQILRSFAGKSHVEAEKIMPEVLPEHSKYWGVQELDYEPLQNVYVKLISEENNEIINSPFVVEEDYLLLLSHWFIMMCSLVH